MNEGRVDGWQSKPMNVWRYQIPQEHIEVDCGHPFTKRSIHSAYVSLLSLSLQVWSTHQLQWDNAKDLKYSQSEIHSSLSYLSNDNFTFTRFSHPGLPSALFVLATSLFHCFFFYLCCHIRKPLTDQITIKTFEWCKWNWHVLDVLNEMMSSSAGLQRLSQFWACLGAKQGFLGTQDFPLYWPGYRESRF